MVDCAETEAPGAAVARMLAEGDAGSRERGLALAVELARDGRLTVGWPLLRLVAEVDEARPVSAAALLDAERLMQLLPEAELPRGARGDRATALFRLAAEPGIRRLAARALDAKERRPDLTLVSERLGEGVAALLVPYLEHSGATHQELLEVTQSSPEPPPFLDGLQRAERTLGPEVVREVIGRLGWSRLSCGFAAELRVGMSVGGSFPFVVGPVAARLLSPIAGAETLWRRHLIVAHGGPLGADAAATSDERVQRFRRYNLTHAALLDEILAVAPLDEAKTRKVLAMMDRVVADFAALFSGTSDDAQGVAAVYRRLCRLVEEGLARDRPGGALSGETVRRLQMFEDPQRLEEVTTVHGLKRYLHQQGLKLAFRLFASQQGANRTVDLVVAGAGELRCEQVIRYLEFEPTQPAGDARLPFVLSLLAEALGRQLLHGRKLPWVTVLGYGNEFQIYVNYRNHPAFIRLDLSPPLRGGMIDLEYFAISQYEMDQHPDLSLQGMQRLFREMEFDVSKDGLRLKARYDKERAVDLGDIVAKARALFELLPYLMDVDWTIGDLDYPPAARAEVAAAWAAFFNRWGVVPLAEVLSACRRKILVAVEPDPAGPREVVWDGRGAYRDRFSGTPPDSLMESLQRELDGRGLGALAAGSPARSGAPGQRLLDQTVLSPVAEALSRGEIRETAAGLEAAPADLFQRDHEAVRLAAILGEGGPALARAVQMAALVRAIERQARFHTTGSVRGYAVEAARLPTAPRAVGLFVLRDGQGIVRLALAVAGGVLHRWRAHPQGPWRPGNELEVAELARALRTYNYLGEVPGGGAPLLEEDLREVRRRFRTPSAAPVPRLSSGERHVPGTVAAPGRATGFALFHTAGRQPADLEGAVLLARAVRPEDTPWLRHAAGIVSTGGGILSHVGLVALELEKPALIVEGRWSAAPSGAEVLLYRRPQWREEESTVAGYQVVCRQELHETEETLEQGDLVAIDGESGGMAVLGNDAQAVGLHQGLRQLEAASAALATARSADEVLASRGRLIRALHQLERLLERLERPALVRHAVRELLTVPRAPLAPEGRQGRARLLGALLRNPASEAEARQATLRLVHGLRDHLEASSRLAEDDLPHLVNPAEVLFTRLGVRRIHETLADTMELVRARGLDPGPLSGIAGVDAACRHRLEALRSAAAEKAEACAGAPDQRWRLRHLLPRLEQLAGILDGAMAARAPQGESRRPARRWAEMAAALRREDAARLSELAGRRLLGMSDGGVELQPLVGGKAAHLGEIARILGPSAVPAWFSVTDAAFREVMAAPAAASALEKLGLGPAEHLEAAIAQVLAHAGWDARRQAQVVRELWRGRLLPAALDSEIRAAYARLSADAGEDLPVAIRSSGHDEDTENAAWAGQFDTFLFVRGADAVIEHLKLAWAGFWTERAIDRRRLLGTSHLARGGGIVVQRMADSRASGVLHTVCAASGQLREMVVNAGLGLGEGIVSGTVDVDHIFVAKTEDLQTADLQLRYLVGDKREQVVRDAGRGFGTRRQETLYHQRLRPALEYVELCELVRDAARLEEVFDEPLDIEFAVEGHRLRILQARPVPIFAAAWRETLPGAAARGKEAP
ncbi:MAG TPA: PEP/pyruvate-binding domain-containing protein [Anaeromyxobacteraceae bacterium]|nr:PEP/pyruvate-binding domain-containing protein [Anaeromyxobacteraceae bacterium]